MEELCEDNADFEMRSAEYIIPSDQFVSLPAGRDFRLQIGDGWLGRVSHLDCTGSPGSLKSQSSPQIRNNERVRALRP
jgi:hypothetical protein